MSCPFAKHSDIFGKPNEGAHSYRVLDIAVVDTVATAGLAIVMSYVISYFNNQSVGILFIIIFLSLILLGILFHRLFCVNTTINKLIFGKI